MFLFSQQSSQTQLLTSVLTTMQLSCALEGKEIQSVIAGCSLDAYSYLYRLQKRDYLRKNKGLFYLTPKAKRLVARQSFILQSSSKKGMKQRHHELLIARSLCLCLQHLNHRQIVTVRKEKTTNSKNQIPDLNIVTRSHNIFIEIDTGSQSIQTIKSKIRTYLSVNRAGIVLFFTSSPSTYRYFRYHPYTHFIYFENPTLTEDILRLKPQPHSPQPKSIKKINPTQAFTKVDNVKLKTDLLANGNEALVAEAVRLFYEN